MTTVKHTASLNTAKELFREFCFSRQRVIEGEGRHVTNDNDSNTLVRLIGKHGYEVHRSDNYDSDGWTYALMSGNGIILHTDTSFGFDLKGRQMSDGFKAQLNDDTAIYAAKSGDMVIIQGDNVIALKWYETPILITRLKEAQAYAESEVNNDDTI